VAHINQLKISAFPRCVLVAHGGADASRQGVKVAGEVACGLSQISLREDIVDGMIWIQDVK
jgi:hypothetical protein